jgi:2-amino-4-hydroxy-6-hydroxymethyldihydropteridine diphosphokinase
MKKYDVALLLGGNMGYQPETFQKAIELIKNFAQVLKVSSYWASAPWGVVEQPDFINQCVYMQTQLQPNELLHELQKIEADLGREDKGLNLPRTLDIDIIWIDKLIWFSTYLYVPHKSLAYRRFALAPFAEILPDALHPYLRKTAAQLLEECIDRLPVTKLESN